MTALTRYLGIVLGALLWLCVAGLAHAQMFVEFDAGASMAAVSHGSPFDAYGPVYQETTPAAAYAIRAGGYQPGGYFGAELVVTHENAPLKPGTLCTWPAPFCQMLPGRKLSISSVGVNGLVRYPGTVFEPYLGIGVAYLAANLGPDVCGNGWTTCGPLSSGYSDSSSRASTVGYTFEAGMLWKPFANDHLGITLSYMVQKARFQFGGTIPGNCCGGLGESLDAGWQKILIGLRYTFDAPGM